MLRSRSHARLSLSAWVAWTCACAGSTTGPVARDDASGGDAVDCTQDFGDPATSPYVLPFPEGHTYRIIQGYCPPDPAWGHHGWFAYDFDFPVGDTIVASRAGRVWFVREDQPNIGANCSGGKENMIIVLHDDGTVMTYAHLVTNGVLVERGDRVETGQIIGLSGNSGCSSGPHLHVSVYRDSTDVGPTASLPFNYRNAIGPLDAQRGLVQGQEYTAGPIDGGR